MKKLLIIASFLGIFVSCSKDDFSYPYTEYGIEYMGLKVGLTTSSSDQAFDSGLNEIIQQYADRNEGASTESKIDGVTYNLTNFREATGGIPDSIWDIFWNELEKHEYSIGSCWEFVHISIPSKRATGDAYAIYAIITDEYNGEVIYKAIRGDASPMSGTRTFSKPLNPFDFFHNGGHSWSTALRQK